MDRLNAVIAEIKEWYAIVFDFILKVLGKAGVSTDNIPEEVYPA